jgi:hypothetical protein
MDVLSDFASSTAAKVNKAWWELSWKLVAKYFNGYVTIGEGAKDQQEPGYPKKWLAATEFARFPGHTYYLPGQEPAWGVHLPEGGRPGMNLTEPVPLHPPNGGWHLEGRSFGLGVLVVLGLQAFVLAGVFVARRVMHRDEGRILLFDL